MQIKKERAFTVLAGSFIALSMAAGVASAVTLAVDCGAGEKIIDKVLAARPGDTVQVSGTCKENVSIPSHVVGITLDGQGKTTMAPPTGDSFFIRGKEITVRGFTMTGGRDGVHLSGAGAGASANIERNVIRKTGRHGIHLDHSSVGRIGGNTIEDVPGIGIDINESAVARIGYLIAELLPNTIRNAGAHGIIVARGSSARIIGNTIVDSRRSGVLVDRNSQADVFGNSLSGNGEDGVTVSYGSGVNLRVEQTAFKVDANQTEGASKNGGFGVRCSIGGYADGPLGTLDGTKGQKAIDNTCVDRLTVK
jgi:parallel beta-helix repeat protein